MEIDLYPWDAGTDSGITYMVSPLCSDFLTGFYFFLLISVFVRQRTRVSCDTMTKILDHYQGSLEKSNDYFIAQ